MRCAGGRRGSGRRPMRMAAVRTRGGALRRQLSGTGAARRRQGCAVCRGGVAADRSWPQDGATRAPAGAGRCAEARCAETLTGAERGAEPDGRRRAHTRGCQCGQSRSVRARRSWPQAETARSVAVRGSAVRSVADRSDAAWPMRCGRRSPSSQPAGGACPATYGECGPAGSGRAPRRMRPRPGGSGGAPRPVPPGPGGSARPGGIRLSPAFPVAASPPRPAEPPPPRGSPPQPPDPPPAPGARRRGCVDRPAAAPARPGGRESPRRPAGAASPVRWCRPRRPEVPSPSRR